MKDFLEKVSKSANISQFYWAWSHPEQGSKKDFLYYENAVELILKMKSMSPQTRFLFHGFFDRSVWPKLLLTQLPSRCSWVCWGHDVYQHKQKGQGIKRKMMFWLHKLLVRRLAHVFSLNDGDGSLIQTLLWNVNVKTLPYPLIGAKSANIEKIEGEPLIILVGNSANPTNEHLHVLQNLSKFSDRHIRIVVPLNYAGPVEYVEKVLAYGQQVFGDKFFPITGMLAKTEYDKLLATADVAVFSHQRQQGLYVVYSMLMNGRKMYMRSNVSSYQYLLESGFSVFDSEKISEMDFDEFAYVSETTKSENAMLMQETFSENALLPKWRDSLLALF